MLHEAEGAAFACSAPLLSGMQPFPSCPPISTRQRAAPTGPRLRHNQIDSVSCGRGGVGEDGGPAVEAGLSDHLGEPSRTWRPQGFVSDDTEPFGGAIQGLHLLLFVFVRLPTSQDPVATPSLPLRSILSVYVRVGDNSRRLGSAGEPPPSPPPPPSPKSWESFPYTSTRRRLPWTKPSFRVHT